MVVKIKPCNYLKYDNSNNKNPELSFVEGKAERVLRNSAGLRLFLSVGCGVTVRYLVDQWFPASRWLDVIFISEEQPFECFQPLRLLVYSLVDIFVFEGFAAL